MTQQSVLQCSRKFLVGTLRKILVPALSACGTFICKKLFLSHWERAESVFGLFSGLHNMNHHNRLQRCGCSHLLLICFPFARFHLFCCSRCEENSTTALFMEDISRGAAGRACGHNKVKNRRFPFDRFHFRFLVNRARCQPR